MAYFCLTLLEIRAGSRGKAAKHLHISKNVLDQLGKLTHEGRGDEKTARKASATFIPHTPAEKAWMDAAVRAIIRRVGEVGGSVPVITMADLPPI